MSLRKTFLYLFCSLLLCCEHLSAQNLIDNPSFENDLASWDTGFWGGADLTYTATEASASEGSKSLEVVVNMSTPSEPFKGYVRKTQLGVEEGKSYILSFDVKSNSGNAEQVGVTLYSHPEIGGATWGVAWNNDLIGFQGDEQWFSFSDTITPQMLQGTPDYNSMVLMFGFAEKVGTYQIDNIRFEPLGGSGSLPSKVYYVAKDGDDSNDGSAEQPFLTIQKAADVAEKGDTVFIGAGTYRETITPLKTGTINQPILYQAMEGAEVIVSGMEPLNGWTRDQGNIYKLQVPFNLGDDNMVLYDDRLCDLARYPNNIDGNPFTVDGNSNSGGSLSHMTGNFPNYQWQEGGFVWYLGNSRWTSWRERITAASQGRIEFIGPSGWEGDAHNPANGGLYVLYNVKEALDYEYEFYFQRAIQTLFLQTPGGVQPEDGQVRMKKRTKGFNLANKSYIVLDGIDHFGCNIEIIGAARGNIVRNLKVTWGSHGFGVGEAAFTNTQSINLRGTNNRVERCEIAWGAHTGVHVAGDGNTIEDCIIHDFNYVGSYSAPILMRAGKNSTVHQSTIYNGGRDLIQSVNQNSVISYNDMHHSNLINDDCGPFYTCCGEHYSEIHHNFVHDCESPGTHYKATGIYLDNSSKYWSVHHNVITNMEWTGIQMNWDDWYIDIYNNSIWNVSESMGTWLPNGTRLQDVEVFNNLSNEGTWKGTDIDKNLSVTESPFMDRENNDFRLKAGSSAIDYGKTVDGIELDFTGSAPDAGAFESGLDPWIPGATWTTNPFFTDVDEPFSTSDQLNIFPNPSSGIFQIDTEELETSELFIFDYSGKQVHYQAQLAPKESVNVQKLGSGIYFIYLKSNNKLRVGKLMKL
ncbi:MAG: right-handed parallel beta-helix repeat-containing protein [Bacteroidota bacterium]